MKIDVERIKTDKDTTVSTVSVDGQFVCFGLEDTFREEKVKHRTRIPQGRYDIKVREYGGFHERYKKKYGFHKGMLEVCDVEGFTDILIHIGNTHKDSSGCLLVGMACNAYTGAMNIASSEVAYKLLYNKVISSALEDDLSIQYYDL